ncbi:DUF3368 domain-containing protein [uncultured Methanobrevibacter sp.]|uniref:DUF3368 domain-containing protein n=1 Tax=uncultured Methanobrevibacter sp. TaxID=253161 RepID=UPI0025F975F2|nr:DUF3368 domain-containing protein [uncultured Methanobrevibacter sp.]
MKLMDTSSLILFFEHIPEYEFIITFSETGEIMVITPQVEEEYYIKSDPSKFNENYNLEKIINNEIIIKKDSKINSLFENRYFFLGKGEKSIMSLALKYKEQSLDYYCVLDDKDARKIAFKLGLNVKGSIGLLLILKEKGLIEKPKELIEKIRQSEFRISDKILEEFNA